METMASRNQNRVEGARGVPTSTAPHPHPLANSEYYLKSDVDAMLERLKRKFDEEINALKEKVVNVPSMVLPVIPDPPKILLPLPSVIKPVAKSKPASSVPPPRLTRKRKGLMPDMRRKQNRYTCSECGEHFGRPSDMKRHQASVHERSTAVSCQYCGNTIRRRDNLRIHLKRCWGKERAITSQLPEQKKSSDHNHSPTPTSAKKKKSLLGELSKTKKGRHTCSECGGQFSRADILKRHKEKMHGKVTGLTCEYCKSTFSRANNLQSHLKHCSKTNTHTVALHTAEQTPSNYKIDSEPVPVQPVIKEEISSTNAEHTDTMLEILGI